MSNQIYFLIPRTEEGFQSSTRVVSTLDELNRKPISHVYIQDELNYPFIRSYCTKKNISLKQRPSFNQLLSDLSQYEQDSNTRVVSVGRNNKEQVETLASKLSEKDWKVEVRELY